MPPIEVEADDPRTMPVIVLADTSGSMSVDGKIGVLNDALQRMIAAFRPITLPDCELAVAVISFGGDQAAVHQHLQPVADITFEPLTANGRTPMGSAFDLAGELLGDPAIVPTRSYRPNLILVSDGIPTDRWEPALQRLNESPQAKRALRFAVGIGADARLDVLETFAEPDGQVVPAAQIEMVTEFFRFVTYTVTSTITRPMVSQADLPTITEYPQRTPLEF